MRSKLRRIICGVFVLLLSTSVTVTAGGLYLQEFATPSTGTASAGAQAWAHDASTAFHNPAGMTRIEGNQVMVGAGALITTHEFETSSSTPYGGGNGGDAGGTTPFGSAHMVYGLSDDLKLGVSLTAQSGASMDYNDTWSGRYQCQSVDIIAMALNSSLGYKVNDWLSVAGGISMIYADLELEVAGNRPGNLSDGKATIDGDDTQGTFNLGAMIELSSDTRLGFTYWYETELDFSGDISLSPSGLTTASDTSLVLPQWARASIYHALNKKVALLGSIGWEDWSSLDNITLSANGGTQPLQRNWDDTWHFSAGIHYRISDPWLLQCGIAYDTSPVDAEDRTADMPVDRQIRYAMGALYSWSESLTIGGALEYVDLGDAEISGNSLVGKYDENNMIVASVSFNWQW